MKNWGSLLNIKGSYTSKIHSISTNSPSYLTTIAANILNVHNKEVHFYFSASYDYITWTDWKEINLNETNLLDEYELKGLAFKYKITMSASKEHEKPYVQSFSIQFDPCAVFENLGDFNIKPKVWIRKKNGNGDIELTNTMTNQKMRLRNLIHDEEVYIHCQKEDIVSNRQNLGVYRYDDHNDEFLELVTGINYLKASGDFDMQVRYQHIFIQQ